MEPERWTVIPGFSGEYEVSTYGQVRSVKLGLAKKRGTEWITKRRILRQNPNTKGYLLSGLSVGGKQRTRPVHRLVAECFIERVDGKDCVNHKDGNKRNNHVDNLEWVDNAENIKHATENGLRVRGSKVHCAKLKESDIPEIREKLANGDSIASISRTYGVDRRQIWAIREKRNWSHVP